MTHNSYDNYETHEQYLSDLQKQALDCYTLNKSADSGDEFSDMWANSFPDLDDDVKDDLRSELIQIWHERVTLWD